MAIKIGICAGHGHNTSGKRSPAGEREWDFNNKVLLGFVAQMKLYQGVTIKRYDDPTGKTDVSLSTRTTKANNDKVDVYISFHHNANTGKWGKWTGTEVHVYKNCTATSEAYKLASKLAPVVANGYGLANRGVKKTNLHITRETHMTAVLIEGGFMDSTVDIKKLRNSSTLTNAGKKIADAVASFYGLKKKATTTTTKKTTTTTATATGTTHTVKKGDTLYAIAKKYGVTVANIKSWNNLKSDTLSIGQKLTVSKVTYHTVKSGDTLWALSKKYGVTVANIKSWNGLKSDTLTIGKKLIVKK